MTFYYYYVSSEPIPIREGKINPEKGDEMKKRLEGFILQKELTSLEKPLYKPAKNRRNSNEEPKYPATVAIHDPSIFLEFSKPVILTRSKEFALVGGTETYYWGISTPYGVQMTPKKDIHYTNSKDRSGMRGLEIPEYVSAYYGLTEGDRVEFGISENIVFIKSVNGCEDPKVFREWKPDLSEFQSDYPLEPLMIEKFGDFDLRVVTLMAPIGLGSSYWFIAPGGSGKTWILVKVYDACLKLSLEDERLYILMAYIGDRPEDAAQYREVLEKYKDKGVRAEIYKAPWDTNPDTQVDLTGFVMKRAQRLTAIGYHVVVLFDAISRTVAAHTASHYADKDSGMISGGLYRDSITEMIAKKFGTHGSYGASRSLTIIGTVLSASDNKKTSESVVDQETSDSSTTGICRLVKIPTLQRPWISVNESETYTRFPDGRDFRSEDQRKEMETVKKKMREDVGSRDSSKAHEILLKYAKDNPLPKY